jgi:hypothetical protein
MREAWSACATIEPALDFETARPLLMHRPPDLLVTNLRLAAYNGLHLIHLAALAGSVRSVIYAERPESWLLQETQTLGAFFEWAVRVPAAIPSYIGIQLPPVDRRNGAVPERRLAFRGGRRAADLAIGESV